MAGTATATHHHNLIIFNDFHSIMVWLIIIATVVCRIKAEICGQDEFTSCGRPLQILSATSEFSFVTRKDELIQLCPDMEAGLHCIRSYTRRCMNIDQRDHFNKLYEGTNQMVHDLCTEGQYQEDFLRHAPCMKQVKRQYDLCSSRYQTVISRLGQSDTNDGRENDASSSSASSQRQQWQKTAATATTMTINETTDGEDKLRMVCCSFQEYMACSISSVRRVCGDETALFTQNFLDKLVDSLMKMHCERFTPESGKCGNLLTGYSAASTSISQFRYIGWLMMILLILHNRQVNNRHHTICIGTQH